MPTSAREELLKLHKKIYNRNKKTIEESVIHEDKSFLKYEKQYLNAVKDYQKISTIQESFADVLQSSLIYIGDYHTLNQSQRSLLRFLKMLSEQTNDFVLCLEVVQSQHQAILDHFMKGKLSEANFVKKIMFKEHWFFDLWQNFKPVFDYAKQNKIATYGIEAPTGYSLNLQQRDKHMASQIFDVFLKNPDKKIIVMVGDLHLAPQHLPKCVDDLFCGGPKPPARVILYQNSESIYWKLARLEKEDQTLIVKVKDNEYCRMHTPPIICQQSYLNWLEHEEDVHDFADARRTCLGYIDQIASFLGLKLGDEKHDIQVFTCGDLSFLKILKESKLFKPRDFTEIKRQILRSESYYIPQKKIIYLANVSVNHAAEQSTRFIRHLCVGDPIVRPMQGAFYALVIDKALGFFGSKIINHRRKCLRPADCRKMISYFKITQASGPRLLDYQIAKTFLSHETQLKKLKPFSTAKIAAFSTDLYNGLASAVGQYLGEKLFYGLLAGKVTKQHICELIQDPFDEEGEVVHVFLDFQHRLKGIKLPKKV